MMPAIAIVSLSCTVTCVLTLRFENDGDWIADVAAGAMGELTSWLMISVTMPLGSTRAMICSVTPEFRFVMLFANTVFPPFCTPAPRGAGGSSSA